MRKRLFILILAIGMTIATQQIVDGIGVTAPSIAGLYLLTWIDQQGNKTTETILVQ